MEEEEHHHDGHGHDHGHDHNEGEDDIHNHDDDEEENWWYNQNLKVFWLKQKETTSKFSHAAGKNKIK